MSDRLVQSSVDRGIARIALDSPRNRNALSAALVEQLAHALDAGRVPTTRCAPWSSPIPGGRSAQART